MENKIKFRQEQRAWSSHFGWGTIYLIVEGSDYPVKYVADYNDIVASYMEDGREFNNDVFPTLFHKEQKLDLSEPEIEKGTLGYFWDNGITHIAPLGKYGGRNELGKHMILDGFYDWHNFCPHPELPPHFKK